MRGGDRNEIGHGLAWRAVVVVGTAGLTVTAASLVAAAMPDGDGRLVSALRGVVVAAVGVTTAFGSAVGLRRALTAGGLPAGEPFLPESVPRALRSPRAAGVAVMAVGLLLGLLGATLDGPGGRGRGDGGVASTAGSDLTSSERAAGGSELTRSGGDQEGHGAPDPGVDEAPASRRSHDDGDDDRRRDGRRATGGDDDDSGDDDDTGDDDDSGDDDDEPGCDVALPTTTLTLPLDAEEVCDTVGDTVDDVRTTVTTLLDTVGTVPTTLPTVPVTVPVTVPPADDLDEVVDDLLGSLF